MHEKLELSGEWRFKCDAGDEGTRLGFHLNEADDWQTINVPSSFDSRSGEHFVGTAWYSKKFDAPKEWEGHIVLVQFQSVNDRATVWVNGIHVGGHDLPFVPFSLSIEKALRFGETNRITVRVDNKGRAGGIPCSGEYFRPQGGIIREVRLLAVGAVRLREVQVIAEPTGDDGRFSINVKIVNDRQEPVKVSLRLKVWNHDCRVRWSFPFGPMTLPADWKTELKLPGHIANVSLWSPENPELYVAEVQLLQGTETIDVIVSKFGFRKIEARGDQLWLNNRLIRLNGFCYFEDSPRTGMVSDHELFREDLASMKAMGANFVRLCGHPHHPHELDICDEIGLLAMAEIPVCGCGALAEQASYETSQRILRRLIKRDRHHPSVICWSVGDAICEEHPEVGKRLNDLLELAKALDRKRLVTHVAERSRWLNAEIPNMFQTDDIICLGGCFSESARVALHNGGYDLAESGREWQRGITTVKERFPNKPILAAAVGYPSINEVDGERAEAVQAQAIEAEVSGIRETSACGAVIRSFADHLVEVSREPQICPCGVVRRDRSRKPAYDSAARLFKKTAVPISSS